MKKFLSVILCLIMLIGVVPMNVLAATKLSAPTVTLSNVASSGKIKVSWNKVSGASVYDIYRATSKNGTYKHMTSKSSTSFVNTSTTAGKTYYYKVRAVSSSGAKGSFSSVKYRTCDLARPEVKASISSKGYPKLTWSKITGAESYRIYRATSKSGTYKLMKTTTSLSYTNTSVTTGKTYYYKVKAICSNSAANSAYSTVVSAKANLKNSTLKVGFIFLHDENSTYDKNFFTAAEQACEEMGVEMVKKVNIAENRACYDAAVELVDEGCAVIFADSFGHEDFMIKAAKKFPDVQFCHATGTKAHTEGLSNYHNAYAAIYEGRYLTGVAAGLKLNEMIKTDRCAANEAKLGFVGAYTYAEVISSYTAFYLGAKSVCPTVKMDVQFTGSWYDETAEKEAANKLINSGCKIISQYADSLGAPAACEKAGIPNVAYNDSTEYYCPNTFLISSKIDWAPYFRYIIDQVQKGKAIDTDWTGSLSTGSVVLSKVNSYVTASETQKKLNSIKSKLIDGSLHVFDTSTFTVDGKKVKSYYADVDTDYSYEGDTQVISNGYFHESEYRSAPYFDLRIDGITLLNEKY